MRIVILAILGLFLVGCSEKEHLSVVAFKVGKADCMLVSQGNNHMLIDTGEEDDGQKIVDYLRQHNITKLDTLIITHFDKDHVGGADYILQQLVVDNIYVPNYDNDSKQTNQFWAALEKTNQQAIRLTEMTAIPLGAAQATIYPPIESYEGDNNNSLVTSIVFGDTSFLFAGDAQAPRLQQLMQSEQLEHTFLKVPHHGRYNEQTAAFIEAVQPQFAVITSSDKNPEDPSTLEALHAFGAEVYTTRQQNITFTSNGETITVQ